MESRGIQVATRLWWKFAWWIDEITVKLFSLACFEVRAGATLCCFSFLFLEEGHAFLCSREGEGGGGRRYLMHLLL